MRFNQISLVCWFLLISAGFSYPFLRATAPFLRVTSMASANLGVAPQFELTDSTGKLFGTKDLTGRIFVVNFFFSRCGGICPAVNGRVAAIRRLYADSREIHFVSISVDPEYDTPEVLSKYATRFMATPDKWSFLTGPKMAVDSILDQFRLVTNEDPNLHTTRVVLVDRKGVIRGYYQATEDDLVKRVSDDIDALLLH